MADPWAVVKTEEIDPWAVVKTEPVRGRPAPKAQARQAPKPRRNAMQEVTGFMANVNRGLGIGDEMAAGIGAIGDVVTGKAKIPLNALASPVSLGAAIRPAFDKRMQQQRGVEDDFNTRRPRVAALARGTGNAATVAIPAGQTANAFAQGSRAINAVRGGTVAALEGAAYAAADRGTGRERFDAATNPLMLGSSAVLGAGAGALGPSRAPKPRQAAASGPVKTLRDAGVNLTPGQSLSQTPVVGGLIKNAENLAQRAPILGPAVRGARSRANDSLVRGVALRALDTIGADLPRSVKPGHDMVAFVDRRIGEVYEQAADMVPLARLDDDFASEMAEIAASKADLPEELASTFDRIMRSRLTRLGDGASGQQIKAIHSELGKIQRSYAKKGEDIMADMLGESRRALMGLIGRADPAAGELVAKADQGWSIYKIMNKAAASTADGVFAPGQLATQVRIAGNQRGVNVVGRGEAQLQDLSKAASQVMPDEFGNPGTADAGGLIALAGLTGTNPVAGASTIAGLTAAATPYFIMGRKVITELPANATRGQLAIADRQLADLAAKDPAVQRLRAVIAERLVRASGVGSAAANSPPPNALARAPR